MSQAQLRGFSLTLLFLTLPAAYAQEADKTEVAAPASVTAAPASVTKDTQRIMGLIPNYGTVNDMAQDVKPLSVKDKWQLFLKSTADPFVMTDVALGAVLSHLGDGVPNYGSDRVALGKRLGAAYADIMSQGALTGAVFPTLLHEDPRYYRLGPKANILKRVGYAMSRVAVTRTDSGTQRPNWSFFLGTAAAVGLSNAWYPAQDRNGAVMGSRVLAISIGSATGNLLPEFWPDIQRRVLPQLTQMLLMKFHRGGSAPNTPAASGN